MEGDIANSTAGKAQNGSAEAVSAKGSMAPGLRSLLEPCKF